MHVRLTRVIEPRGRIHAIKNLRAATDPILSLKDAKNIVDVLVSGVTHVDVEVANPLELNQSFEYHTAVPDGYVPVDLVVEFILDALAWADPESARRIMEQPSFKRIKEAC